MLLFDRHLGNKLLPSQAQRICQADSKPPTEIRRSDLLAHSNKNPTSPLLVLATTMLRRDEVRLP